MFEKVYGYDTSFDYFSTELTETTLKKLDNLNEFMVSEGLISSKVDMNSFVDKSYYEEAKAEYDKENNK